MSAKKRPPPAGRPGSAGRSGPSGRKSPPRGSAAARKATPGGSRGRASPGPAAGVPQPGRVAVASAPLLTWLHARPAWVVPVTMLVVSLVGLFTGGVVGLVCLGLIAIFLSWLLSLSWPLLGVGKRAVRLVVVGAVGVLAVVQLWQ